MTWSWSYAIQILPQLLPGLVVTVEVSLLASAIALALGLLVAIFQYKRIPVASWVVDRVVDVLRGTPILIQLYFVFYVLPEWGITISAFTTGVLCLGIRFSAFTSQVYRAGIDSVPRGQWDAATALDLPNWLTWRVIIMPQALRPMIPALANYVIVMFKDSVILSAITVNELMNRGLALADLSYRYLEPLTLIGFLFFIISYPLAKLNRLVEKKFTLT